MNAINPGAIKAPQTTITSGEMTAVQKLFEGSSKAIFGIPDIDFPLGNAYCNYLYEQLDFIKHFTAGHPFGCAQLFNYVKTIFGDFYSYGFESRRRIRNWDNFSELLMDVHSVYHDVVPTDNEEAQVEIRQSAAVACELTKRMRIAPKELDIYIELEKANAEFCIAALNRLGNTRTAEQEEALSYAILYRHIIDSTPEQLSVIDRTHIAQVSCGTLAGATMSCNPPESILSLYIERVLRPLVHTDSTDASEIYLANYVDDVATGIHTDASNDETLSDDEWLSVNAEFCTELVKSAERMIESDNVIDGILARRNISFAKECFDKVDSSEEYTIPETARQNFKNAIRYIRNWVLRKDIRLGSSPFPDLS